MMAVSGKAQSRKIIFSSRTSPFIEPIRLPVAMELNGRSNYRKKGFGSLPEIEEKYTVTRWKKKGMLENTRDMFKRKLQFSNIFLYKLLVFFYRIETINRETVSIWCVIYKR